MSSSALSIDLTTKTPIDRLADNKQQLAKTLAETGVVVLPGAFADDQRFIDFESTIVDLVAMLSTKAGADHDPEASLSDQLSALANADRSLAGEIYALGTRPNKLLTAVMLKTHPAIIEFLSEYFGSISLLASPSTSDTLHLFAPGDGLSRNLPEHQDFPYLMQSPNQLTFWINLTESPESTGGVRVWSGSHTLGIIPQTRNEYGHLRVDVDPTELAKFPIIDIHGQRGDLVIMDSLLVHQSLPNTSQDSSRLTALFRYADLRDPRAAEWNWRSTETPTKGVAFEDYFSA